MLSHTRPYRQISAGAAGQRGVVLLIALIVLVALTLAGVALIRSVDTTNLIAGNMSFQQSAIQSGERSTEDALTWLQDSANDLNNHNAANGFRAKRADPVANQSWDSFWTDTLGTQAKSLPKDVAGNTVSYVIHRLCDNVGPPATVNCSLSPESNGGTQDTDGGTFTEIKTYYRITARIAGPRHTVAYIQTIVTR